MIFYESRHPEEPTGAIKPFWFLSKRDPVQDLSRTQTW